MTLMIRLMFYDERCWQIWIIVGNGPFFVFRVRVYKTCSNHTSERFFQLKLRDLIELHINEFTWNYAIRLWKLFTLSRKANLHTILAHVWDEFAFQTLILDFSFHGVWIDGIWNNNVLIFIDKDEKVLIGILISYRWYINCFIFWKKRYLEHKMDKMLSYILIHTSQGQTPRIIEINWISWRNWTLGGLKWYVVLSFSITNVDSGTSNRTYDYFGWTWKKWA